MFARKAVFSSIGRATVMATVAAMALTVVEPSLARAGSAPSGNGLSAAAATSGATDFSARAQGLSRRRRRRGAAAFAGIVGTGLAIAATQNRRAYYDDYDGYGGPAYYGGGPVYYGGGPGYYGGGYGYYGGSSEFGGQPTANGSARLSRRSSARRLVTMFPPTDRSAGRAPRGRRISSQSAVAVNTLATGLD